MDNLAIHFLNHEGQPVTQERVKGAVLEATANAAVCKYTSFEEFTPVLLLRNHLPARESCLTSLHYAS